MVSVGSVAQCSCSFTFTIFSRQQLLHSGVWNAWMIAAPFAMSVLARWTSDYFIFADFPKSVWFRWHRLLETIFYIFDHLHRWRLLYSIFSSSLDVFCCLMVGERCELIVQSRYDGFKFRTQTHITVLAFSYRASSQSYLDVPANSYRYCVNESWRRCHISLLLCVVVTSGLLPFGVTIPMQEITKKKSFFKAF